jgi:putative endonuclease
MAAMPECSYFVYIMASRSLTLYIGVTGNLQRRVAQHKHHSCDGFTSNYMIDRLVYFERYNCIHNAINREKQLKRWRREKKIALVKSMNPTWIDLSEEWGKPAKLHVTSPSSHKQDLSSRAERPQGAESRDLHFSRQ